MKTCHACEIGKQALKLLGYALDMDIAAITVGADTTIILDPNPSPQLICHERMHQKQIKRLIPWWGKIPFLRKWAKKVAFGKFLKRYVQQIHAVGYYDNRYEIEAREAEATYTKTGKCPA